MKLSSEKRPKKVNDERFIRNKMLNLDLIKYLTYELQNIFNFSRESVRIRYLRVQIAEGKQAYRNPLSVRRRYNTIKYAEWMLVPREMNS